MGVGQLEAGWLEGPGYPGGQSLEMLSEPRECVFPYDTTHTRNYNTRAGAWPHLPQDNIPIPEWQQSTVLVRRNVRGKTVGERDSCPAASLRWDFGRTTCSEVSLPRGLLHPFFLPSWSQVFPKVKFYLLPKPASCPAAYSHPCPGPCPFLSQPPTASSLHCHAHTQTLLPRATL